MDENYGGIELFAGALAAATADQQAAFFNEFGRSLNALCRGSVIGSAQLQTLHIADKLTPATVDVLRDLVTFFDMQKQELEAVGPQLTEKKRQLAAIESSITVRERQLNDLEDRVR